MYKNLNKSKKSVENILHEIFALHETFLFHLRDYIFVIDLRCSRPEINNGGPWVRCRWLDDSKQHQIIINLVEIKHVLSKFHNYFDLHFITQMAEL